MSIGFAARIAGVLLSVCVATGSLYAETTTETEATAAVELQKLGDGKSDATAALQAALQRGIVELPAGTYRVTRSLEVKSNQGVVGPGKLLVDFDSEKPDASNAALHAQGSNIRFEGFTIEKKFIDGSYGTGILVESGSRNIVVRNLEISGYSARYGIHLQEVENFEISSCYIHDFMMNGTADMIEDSPAGIRVTRSRWGVISNNRLTRIEVGAQGLVSISPFRPQYGPQQYQSDHMTVMQSMYISLTGNVMDVSGEGIDMLLSSYCTLTGNVIRDVWNQGIKMLGVSHCTVTGNSILDCFQGIGLDEHKNFNSPADGNVVTGNSILYGTEVAGAKRKVTGGVNQTETYGIVMRGKANDNVIVGNVIKDLNTTAPVMSAAISPHYPTNIVTSNNDETTTVVESRASVTRQ